MNHDPMSRNNNKYPLGYRLTAITAIGLGALTGCTSGDKVTVPTETTAPVEVTPTPTSTPTPEVTPTPTSTPTPTETEAPAEKGPSVRSDTFKELDRIDDTTFNLLPFPKRAYYSEALQQEMLNTIDQGDYFIDRLYFGYMDDDVTFSESTSELHENVPIVTGNIKNTPLQVANQILFAEHLAEIQFNDDDEFQPDKARKILSTYTVGTDYIKDKNNDDPRENRYYQFVDKYLFGGIGAMSTGAIVRDSPRVTRVNQSESYVNEENQHIMSISFTVGRDIEVPLPGSNDVPFYSASDGENGCIIYDMKAVFIPNGEKNDKGVPAGTWAVYDGFIGQANQCSPAPVK